MQTDHQKNETKDKIMFGLGFLMCLTSAVGFGLNFSLVQFLSIYGLVVGVIIVYDYFLRRELVKVIRDADSPPEA
jgi:uncharacterized membrane protein